MQFVACLYATIDLLDPIQHLQKTLQQDGILPHVACQKVQRCKELLSELAAANLEDAVPRGAFKHFLGTLKKSGVLTISLKRRFVGHYNVRILLKGAYDAKSMAAFKKTFTTSCLDSFDQRFPKAKVLEAFRIFDPATYHNMSRDALNPFGIDQLKVLIAHFYNTKKGHTLIDLQDSTNPAKIISDQFRNLKNIIHGMAHEGGMTINKAWQNIHSMYGPDFNMLYPLVYAMFVIPMSTATVERGFSIERVVKNRLSNRLLIVTLDSLLRIFHLKPSDFSEFDFDAASKAYLEDKRAPYTNLFWRLHADIQ